MTFPWQNNSFPWQFILFFNLSKEKKQLLTVINGNPPPPQHTHTGFLMGKSLTVIISRPWVYICQPDTYINTTLIILWMFQSKNNVMIKFPDNSLTWHYKIPWQFPDMGQMDKIPWHFFKIPWLFPDLEKILLFPDISLTRGNPG